MPEAAQLEDTELDVSLSSRNIEVLSDFCFSLYKTHSLPQYKYATKHSNHLEQVDHHDAKDWTYRRSGNFRVIKFSCFKFSRKNIFVVLDTHENILTVNQFYVPRLSDLERDCAR